MTIEILHSNGLFQFKVDELDPMQLKVRRAKMGARWHELSKHGSREEAIAALLAAKDNELGTVRVTIEVLPFGVPGLAHTVYELSAYANHNDYAPAVLRVVNDTLGGDWEAA